MTTQTGDTQIGESSWEATARPFSYSPESAADGIEYVPERSHVDSWGDETTRIPRQLLTQAEPGESTTDWPVRSNTGTVVTDPSRFPRLEWVVRPRSLPADVARLGHIMWTIILSKALQQRFPILRAEGAIERDVEERTTITIVRIYAKANAAQTLAFWDSLSWELDSWVARLGVLERDVIMEKLGVRFHW